MVNVHKICKSIVLVYIAFAIGGCKSSKKAFNVQTNNQLVYNITTGGSPYNFIVEVVNRQPDLTFNYSMTNAANTRGQLVITQGDLDTAHGQFNYFGGGKDTLRRMTSVWISKACYQEIITDKKTVFEFPAGFGMKKETYSLTKEEDYTISVNGKPLIVSTLVLKNEKGNMYRILKNPNDPLVLQMELGFQIEIKEINVN